MKKEKVLITVKTYPTLSSKYGELVCTAGIRASDGEWIRIYPMPFRSLKEDFRYKKYQWVNIELQKNKQDHRIDSYRPVNIHDLELLDSIPTSDGWNARKRIVLNPKHLYFSLDSLLAETKAGNRSIAVFKPAKFIDFRVESVDREWEENKLRGCKALLSQPGLFDEGHLKEIRPVEKIPYKFKIKFSDESGKESTMMVEDWEICELYRKCIRSSDSEEEAVDKVRKKYESFMYEKDLYLILGTTKAWHSIAPNPYIIIGLFYPPFEIQRSFVFGDY